MEALKLYLMMALISVIAAAAADRKGRRQTPEQPT